MRSRYELTIWTKARKSRLADSNVDLSIDDDDDDDDSVAGNDVDHDDDDDDVAVALDDRSPRC